MAWRLRFGRSEEARDYVPLAFKLAERFGYTLNEFSGASVAPILQRLIGSARIRPRLPRRLACPDRHIARWRLIVALSRPRPRWKTSRVLGFPLHAVYPHA